ncbi:phosphoribosylanthranilate isomerase [Roseiconus lacunae]|uniref:N-(5'-phosphoribosyl)anthranilate isomerase n=2 Tax=Roseiconus lacunae TaxID=2605694 RepID=A0ABT7PJB4_9BACT|nr:phosphoribosylanthranilate isomerase [Roseiconus lacunae]MDM4016596.1 phosphoribosylanthranilate isomerase [Roseiconus lacunae]
MFRIKICGVRFKNDVDAVEQSGADAIGLNFFPPSIRYVDPAAPATYELAAAANSAGLLRVGVFVNTSVDQMTTIADTVGLDVIQLHGDETVSIAQALLAEGRRIIRAIKLPRRAMSVNEIESIAGPWSAIGIHLLLDADAGSAHGGSGKTLHWASIARWAEQAGPDRWTLAGGLKPENIAEAVRTSHASSIDTASGVECPKGVKNEGRIFAFASNSGLSPQRDHA